jgi:hypothetical protein
MPATPKALCGPFMLLAVGLACQRSTPSDPLDRPIDATAPAVTQARPLTLLSPLAGARIRQNDAALGCPSHPFRGSGFAIAFDWLDAAPETGVAEYHLFVKHAGSRYPWIDGHMAASENVGINCNAFVIDPNLHDWYWLVEALDSVGTVVAASDTGRFSFEPCRLGSGAACSAPATSSPVVTGVVRDP